MVKCVQSDFERQILLPEYILRTYFKYVFKTIKDTIPVFELLSKDAEGKSTFTSHFLHYNGRSDTAMENLPHYKKPLLLIFMSSL